jgi:phosphopantetheine adenylyltransferase
MADTALFPSTRWLLHERLAIIHAIHLELHALMNGEPSRLSDLDEMIGSSFDQLNALIGLLSSPELDAAALERNRERIMRGFQPSVIQRLAAAANTLKEKE